MIREHDNHFGASGWHVRTVSSVIGENVRMLRRQQDLSKKTFSLMVGIGRPLLDKIESGEADLRVSYIVRIADGLSVEPADLLLPHEHRQWR